MPKLIAPTHDAVVKTKRYAFGQDESSSEKVTGVLRTLRGVPVFTVVRDGKFGISFRMGDSSPLLRRDSGKSLVVESVLPLDEKKRAEALEEAARKKKVLDEAERLKKEMEAPYLARAKALEEWISTSTLGVEVISAHAKQYAPVWRFSRKGHVVTFELNQTQLRICAAEKKLSWERGNPTDLAFVSFLRLDGAFRENGVFEVAKQAEKICRNCLAFLATLPIPSDK